MQLKLQRSQRAGGLTGSTVLFCLDVRADYSSEETDNIRKYKLGGQGIYSSQRAKKHWENAGTQLDRTQGPGTLKDSAAGLARGAFSMALASMSLNISIASLAKGHHIECKDLEELLEAEDTIRTACKNVTRYLEVAATFNGSEVVIEYEKGEEKVHLTPSAPPLLAYAGPVADEAVPDEPERFSSDQGDRVIDPGAVAAERLLELEQSIMDFFGARGFQLSHLQTRLLLAAVVLLVLFLLIEIL